MEYKVTKQHWGDRQYYEGDTREVKVKSDADILIGMGLIANPDDTIEPDAKEEKAAPRSKNKMAKEPENKAE